MYEWLEWFNLAVPILIALVYLLPGIVADCRNHRHSRYITILNILTGWTVVGWLIALVWACQDQTTGIPDEC